MEMNNHEELLTRAEALSVRLDLLDEATGLQRAIASHLRRSGIPGTRERDVAASAALDRFEAANNGWTDEDPLSVIPFCRSSAEELAEMVADGDIHPHDERIKPAAWLARKLLWVTVQAARFERILYPAATPLVIPDDLDPELGKCELRDTVVAKRSRKAYCLKYAWALPCEAALDTIAALGPIIEVGAGGGYWAQLLRERGADVLAFDKQPNPVHNMFLSRQWGPVHEAPAAIAGRHSDRTLLMVWPPYESPMARQALQAYRGKRFVYVGEYGGGNCADDDFFELLYEEWDTVQEVDIPRWGGIDDSLTIYERR